MTQALSPKPIVINTVLEWRMLGMGRVKKMGGNWDGRWEEGSKKMFGNYCDGGNKDPKSVCGNGHIKEKNGFERHVEGSTVPWIVPRPYSSAWCGVECQHIITEWMNEWIIENVLEARVREHWRMMKPLMTVLAIQPSRNLLLLQLVIELGT